MREIKFRGWDPRSKEMVDWMCLDLDSIFSKENELVIMQFSGLTDKNGVDIYELDVVYIAGFGDLLCEFPFIDIYEAGAENDIGGLAGNIFENPDLWEVIE